jgi:hypothetical protein
VGPRSRLPGHILSEHFQEGRLGDFQLSRMNASPARAIRLDLGAEPCRARPTSGGGSEKGVTHV